MKLSIHIKHQDSELSEDQKRVIDDFIKYLQNKFKLKNNINILFLGDRIGDMTTGSKTSNNTLKILSSDRMLIDILRTLSHEWVHQYQDESMDMDFSQDIGGPAEDMANIESGKLIKMFQKEFPQYLGLLYQ